MKSAAQFSGPPLGLRLLKTRGALSQPARAAQLGVHKNTYARWEHEQGSIPHEALTLIVAEGWNLNWLLTGEGPERLRDGGVAPEGASQGVSGEHLSIALELADEALTGLWLPKRGYADLVALIYDGITQGLPYAEILDFARPAATQMTGGGNDVGGTELGGEGAGSVGSGKAAAG